tara:strand:- start:70 stop:381 length:312 start_codon:yes stop_codon:yes gene_type:complete
MSDNIYHIPDFEKNLEKRLHKFNAKDQEYIKRFLTDHEANDYSVARLNKYLFTLGRISRNLDKPFKELEKEDVKGFLAWLERSKYKSWTKHNYKTILNPYGTS